MAPYYPISICRSDGVLEYTLNGSKIPNQPKSKDLEPAPNSQGQVAAYHRLSQEDIKTVQWRRKLAGMLMELLGGPEHTGTLPILRALLRIFSKNASSPWHSTEKNYVLKELPEDYVLWQHVKYSADSAQTTGPQKKTHAAAGTERNDAFLYGHPGGRSKKYRSPQEFFPHLLWLATDKEGNRLNCSCKNCSPDKRSGADTTEDASKNTNLDQGERPETVPDRNAKSIMSSRRIDAAASVPIPSSSLFRPTRSAEQELDRVANGKYLYRPGELVWFSKGPAWGLAVICKRQYVNSAARYLLQPLSHPLHHPPPQIKDQESIRPWLAWSLPQTTHSQIRTLKFDEVPWERVVRGDFGAGDAEVDGSILASKAVDGAYNLFDRLQIPTAATSEVCYRGMFLGGEKVWVGEPVRISADRDDIVILIIEQMIERATSMSSAVTLVGDVYKFVEMPTPYKDRSTWPTQNLPPRMVADLRFRNEVADNAKRGIWYEWRLLEPAARKSLSEIKGRWYESRSLIPILRGAEAAKQEIGQGATSDTSIWMNARGDNSSPEGQRKKNRLDTLGNAVPKDLKISRGLDGLPADDFFPDQQAAPQTSPPLTNVTNYEAGLGSSDADLRRYVNLDQGAGQQDFYGSRMRQ
ncbi:MAG: hypothetical protein M1818_006119 [Claussenomyces sp. TS43310]|nr:MAG: hypothetical protein M1818_006119 [Claussenomyces sp. TS43310]